MDGRIESPPLARSALRLKREATHRGDKRFDVLGRIVERERRPHRALECEPAQDGLCAVMARAHRDSLPVKRLSESSVRTPSSTG